MSAVAPSAVGAATASWWARGHHRLLPDYNRKAATYWWTVTLLGAATLVHAVTALVELPTGALLQVLAGIVIAALAGMFPVRVPHSKNSFAAGEIFIFVLLLLHGPAAAALAAAAESGVGAWRTSKRWSSRIASPTMAALAISASGWLFLAGNEALEARGLLNEGALLVLAVVFALAYFAANTLLVTLVAYLKRNQAPVWREWLASFGWLGITYAASASVAAMLFLTFRQFGVGVLIAAAPIIGGLMSTLHFYFRQQEADGKIRKQRVEAAEREAAQAAREAAQAVLHMRDLEASEARFQNAFTHAAIGMALIDVGGKMLQVNPALCALLGQQEASFLGRRFDEFLFAEEADGLAREFGGLIERKVESLVVELRCRHSAGEELWVALHCAHFLDSKSSVPRLILQVQDITARREAQAQLHRIAYYDGLTGLPNRNRFYECLRQAIARLGGERGHQFSVMFLDFDRFKIINDSLGHGAGDEFLRLVARRIQENMRPIDLVARLGGDEFAILTEDVECERRAVDLANRLQDVLRRPLALHGTEISTSVSIGITFSGFGYRTPEEVLRDADIAMYRAKAEGKGRYALFDAGMRRRIAEQLQLEGDLRRAVEADQFSLAYQPLYELNSGSLTGFEALVRWQQPERGAIGPLTFIPIAEELGLIGKITDFVVDRACKQLKKWQGRGSAFADLEMQVNISAHDLMQSAFAQRVRERVRRAGLKPAHLTLEITETTLMQQLGGAVDTMQQLRSLGIGLSVDDFGTGYSSLAYLSTLPINSLKIDRSFVSALQASARNSEIVKAVVTLGDSLGMAVIAEGIETCAQLDELRNIGCEFGQGYHLSRPLSEADADALVEGLALKCSAATNGAEDLALMR